MKLNSSDINWENGKLVYKGIMLDLTVENIQDYKYQTGMDSDNLIIMMYENSISKRREEKLNQILNDRL